jgi:hypothetical protein
MLETQSRLDLAEATVLEAKDALQSAKDVLEGVVGTEVTGLDHLRAGFHVTPADTKGYEEWKRVALDNNPDLQALTKGIEISRQEINKARSGHVPRLDVVGTYGKLASDTINTYNQDQARSARRPARPRQAMKKPRPTWKPRWTRPWWSCARTTTRWPAACPAMKRWKRQWNRPGCW